MTKAVVTTNGTLAANAMSQAGPTVDHKGTPLTDEQAEADCKRRNERAVELGIQTRYEVKDI